MNIPDTLLYRILNKKCILFLGAGATLESGGVLGSGLAKYLYDQLGDTGVELSDDLPRFTYNLVRKGFRSEIEEIVRNRFKNLTPSKRFENISSIPWRAIYTTNYDDLIEKAYKSQRYYEYSVENPLIQKQAVNDSKVPLYKINGDINVPYSRDNPLIITLEDLKLGKKSSQIYISRLMEDLNDTFVFIGYSFADKIIVDILESFSNNDRWESIKEKYLVLPDISEDLKADLELYKIKFIKGTADDFFEEIYQKTEKDYKAKLLGLKLLFSADSPLSDFEPRTMNYISECFDFYNSSKTYPTDPLFFYRGGTPNWGIIKNDYDVGREMDVTELNNTNARHLNTCSLVDLVFELSCNNKLMKLLLRGPAVSGKTTLIYRLAFELTEKGVLTFLFKTQSDYKTGLLFDIYKKLNSSFVVIIDDVIIDSNQVFKMITDAQKNNIPAIFIVTARYSDWGNVFGNYNKTRLQPLDYFIDIKDSLALNEAQKLANKMIESKILSVSTQYDKEAMVKKISRSHNIIDILLEIIDRSENAVTSICNEYDTLSREAQLAYGVVSLSYRYGLKLQWGLLKRSIEERYSFTWEDFICKILKEDAKGNLFEEEIQGEYFLTGRHRHISEIIIQIHYKGNYSDEIADIENLVRASAGNNTEEYFMGTLINAILQNECYYDSTQIESLLNFTIDIFKDEKNKSFINHLKGEFLLGKPDYMGAISCFDANVQNDLNTMHSLHSLGKTYFYLAKSESVQSGKFRRDIDYAQAKLFDGISRFSKNEYYYTMLLQIFNYLESNNCLSEKDEIDRERLKNLAQINLNIQSIDKLEGLVGQEM